MGLNVRFVASLDDIVPLVVSFLVDSPSDDIFEPEHIIVPNAGVRSWLLQRIAGAVGVGAAGFDGVAANINIGYLGQLDGFIGRGDVDTDPWNVGPLAVSILAVISREGSPFFDRVNKMGGGLKAARALADRFDRYQARRPSMIREWEKGNAVLAPEVGGEVVGDLGGEHLVALPALSEADRWQFDLWREVRAYIGSPPWPVDVSRLAETLSPDARPHGLPTRLLIAGLQSLSVRHIELVSALSRVVDIEVVLVHPSPALATTWADEASSVAVSPGIAPRASTVPVNDDVDQLVSMWLRGARDTQLVLASQGIAASAHVDSAAGRTDTLLRRVQASISSGVAVAGVHSAGDTSVHLHRAHNLSRQVEVLHDALLHAFHDLPGLEPHDVVVLCANIEDAAPLLEAAFDRECGEEDGSYRLPLVVADRSLRDVDDGASLLVAVLRAVRGRFSVDDIMQVASSAIVLRAHGASSDDIATWARIIDQSVVRWGASAEHRARLGVDVPGLTAHTWSLAIDRAILGAVLPDAEPGADMAGVVPLLDVDAADVSSVTVLSRIVSVLSMLESETSGESRSIEEWADVITGALSLLADAGRGDLDDAFAAVDSLRFHARCAGGKDAPITPVSFAHVADLVEEIVSGAPGRQPLRTGAITATSLIPLRGVPFKVVCLVGFDEGTVPSGDADGDDLLDRQTFAGDVDARLEFRRAILDAACSASERLIITCNGKSIRNNADLPLITPLAEFVDLCVRCGAELTKGVASFEHHHPRHFSSRRNFVVDGVVPGLVWSHNRTACDALSDDGSSHARSLDRSPAGRAERGAIIVSPTDLRNFMADPLHAFVSASLGINTWVDRVDDVAATIPLNVNESTIIELCDDLRSAVLAGFTHEQWDVVQTTTGNLPPGVYGADARGIVKGRVGSMFDKAAEWGVDLSNPTAIPVRVVVGAIELAGAITVYPAADGRLATASFRKPSSRRPAADRMAFELLLLCASGHPAAGIVITGHDEPDKCIARHVELGEGLSPESARERVEQMLSLFARAMESPFPLFGETALALSGEGAQTAFAKAVGDADYLKSTECLVYGPVPIFDRVFPVGGAERDFFADFAPVRLVRAQDAEKSLGGVKPPSGGRVVQRYIFQ